MISGCNGKTVMSTFFRQFVLSVNRNLTIYSSNAQLQITYTLIQYLYFNGSTKCQCHVEFL
jgi:hypothetical protein